jgi:hypothetical protein
LGRRNSFCVDAMKFDVIVGVGAADPGDANAVSVAIVVREVMKVDSLQSLMLFQPVKPLLHVTLSLRVM